MLTKTFFPRPPMTAGRFAPLPAGAVLARGSMRERLVSLRAGLLSRALSLAAHEDSPLAPDALEAALLVSAQLGEEELRRKAMRLIDRTVDGQREDGSFGQPGERFAAWGRMLRAVCCAYTLCGEKRLLTFMLRYMKYLSESLKTEPLGEEDAMHVADTLESGVFLYNVTGQKAILPVLGLLIGQGADYTSLFHAFPYRAPVSRSHPETADAQAEKSEFTLRLLRTADGANLCEGLRASGLSGVVTGSGKHLSAPEAGLARLIRAHGAACGGIAADPLLAGTHPGRGVTAASLGELAASLETLMTCPDGDFGFDRLETLMYNGVAAAFSDDFLAVQRAQQANQLAVDGAIRFPLLGERASAYGVEGAEPLLSAWPRFLQHQWMLTRDEGLCAMGYAPCSVRYRLGGVGVRVSVESDYPASGSVRIALSLERETAFPLVLRIPEWARGATVAVGGEIVPAQAGSFLTLGRQWHDGDTLLLTLPMAVETQESFHQAVSVARGPLRFAYAPKARETEGGGLCADGPFGVALVRDAPIEAAQEGGRVVLRAQVRALPGWEMRGPSADQPPIAVQGGGEAFCATLVPYAEARVRVAVLPLIP